MTQLLYLAPKRDKPVLFALSPGRSKKSSKNCQKSRQKIVKKLSKKSRKEWSTELSIKMSKKLSNKCQKIAKNGLITHYFILHPRGTNQSYLL
jgi:hypothetical protein